MIYEGRITVKRLIKENVYVSVEADSEEEALEQLREGNYDLEESEEIDDLGIVDVLNMEIIDYYD